MSEPSDYEVLMDLAIYAQRNRARCYNMTKVYTEVYTDVLDVIGYQLSAAEYHKDACALLRAAQLVREADSE